MDNHITITGRSFAECLGHSAKLYLHSAKALPSATLSKGISTELYSAKGSFTECQMSNTRQKFLPSALDTR